MASVTSEAIRSAGCRSIARPGDRALQTRILRDALHLVESAREGGILVDLPYAWGEDVASILDA